MKRSLTLISAALLAGTLSAPVLAQTAAPGGALPAPIGTPRYDAHHKYADKFGDFLDSHPSMEQQLSRDPRLVDDKAYMNSNPELKEYLENHPGVRERFKQHPNQFIHRVERTQGSDGHY